MIETAIHISGITCDAAGCDASVPGPGGDGIPWMIPLAARPRLIGAALEHGWSAWWSHGRQWHRCPDHAPEWRRGMCPITLADLGEAPAGGWSWW